MADWELWGGSWHLYASVPTKDTEKYENPGKSGNWTVFSPLRFLRQLSWKKNLSPACRSLNESHLFLTGCRFGADLGLTIGSLNYPCWLSSTPPKHPASSGGVGLLLSIPSHIPTQHLLEAQFCLPKFQGDNRTLALGGPGGSATSGIRS